LVAKGFDPDASEINTMVEIPVEDSTALEEEEFLGIPDTDPDQGIESDDE